MSSHKRSASQSPSEPSASCRTVESVQDPNLDGTAVGHDSDCSNSETYSSSSTRSKVVKKTMTKTTRIYLKKNKSSVKSNCSKSGEKLGSSPEAYIPLLSDWLIINKLISPLSTSVSLNKESANPFEDDLPGLSPRSTSSRYAFSRTVTSRRQYRTPPHMDHQDILAGLPSTTKTNLGYCELLCIYDVYSVCV